LLGFTDTKGDPDHRGSLHAEEPQDTPAGTTNQPGTAWVAALRSRSESEALERSRAGGARDFERWTIGPAVALGAYQRRAARGAKGQPHNRSNEPTEEAVMSRSIIRRRQRGASSVE